MLWPLYNLFYALNFSEWFLIYIIAVFFSVDVLFSIIFMYDLMLKLNKQI